MSKNRILNLEEELRIERGMNECLIRGMQDDTEKRRWEMSKLHEEMNKMKDDYESKIRVLEKKAYEYKRHHEFLVHYTKSLEKKLEEKDILYNKDEQITNMKY
jgi:hypothetical protein